MIASGSSACSATWDALPSPTRFAVLSKAEALAKADIVVGATGQPSLTYEEIARYTESSNSSKTSVKRAM